MDKLARAVAKRVHEGGATTRGKISQLLKSGPAGSRQYLDEALALAVDFEWLVTETMGRTVSVVAGTSRPS